MKSLSIFVMSLILCSLLYSQENSSDPQYALTFGIADNFRLDRFNMDIAVKKIIDETHQLRLFLSPRVYISDDEENTNGANQTQEREASSYSLGVGADYLWILITNEDINMFGGTGLVFTYEKGNEKFTTISENGDKNINERSIPTTSAGIRGTLGVEWKVSEKIGIHSEYLLNGSYGWSESENKSSLNGINNPIVSRSSKRISLSSGVLLGVSIYF